MTKFEVDDEYISRYEVQAVGVIQHQELWIPAKELDEFNRHIVGVIEVVASHYGEKYSGFHAEA